MSVNIISLYKLVLDVVTILDQATKLLFYIHPSINIHLVLIPLLIIMPLTLIFLIQPLQGMKGST